MAERSPSPRLRGMSRPLVSVIVPSFNQGRFIGETLRSILDQDYRPLEVLVLDGASSDETVSVLRSFGDRPELRWWSEPDSGVVEAVNKGFARATGVIGAIQSSDDTYLPGAIAAAVDAMTADPELGLVYGDVTKVHEDGRTISTTHLRPYGLEALLALETWIPQPSAFFSLSLARTLGGWREQMPYAADTDLWLRIAVRRRVRKVERVLGKRRVHDAQRDRNGAAIIRDYGLMLAAIPELSQTRGLRRAAAAGHVVIRMRYSYGASRLTNILRAWRLLWLRPSTMRYLGADGLIPFLAATRQRLSQSRRWFRRVRV
jgi:glycosyltransferase involved in cell wall biosynthesis